ncbi:MAG: F-type H+-transporting ATPase subunit b [Actinomycetota bacterium]|jgi:F-type H+-transporting ATPase subunit b|nr:F-type H+-transporting ATPase subunit b [Actinomycetota bacterium]
MVFATHAVVAAAKTNNPILPNGTIIAELVAFVILLWLFWRYALPPLKRAMTQRQDFIERQIKESEEARERLEQAEQEYKELLEQTRADASRIREEARAEGRAIIAELRQKAEDESARIRERGEAQLAAERDQVIAAVRSDLGKLAADLAVRIVGESLEDDERQRRIVDRFLDDLDARTPQETH